MQLTDEQKSQLETYMQQNPESRAEIESTLASTDPNDASPKHNEVDILPIAEVGGMVFIARDLIGRSR